MSSLKQRIKGSDFERVREKKKKNYSEIVQLT